MSRTRAAVVAASAAGAVLAGAVLVGGCESPSHTVSRQLGEEYLPHLGTSADFGGVADWRRLSQPSPRLRSYFDLEQGTYRVVSASRDRASLVVWKRDSPGAQPLDGNVTAIGVGCVELSRRADGRVRSTVTPCPAHLGPFPDSYPASWGRDSAARQDVDAIAAGVGADVEFLIDHRSDGRPRRTPPTRGQLLATARSRVLGRGEVLIARPTARQRPGRFAATLSISASAPDPVDVRRLVTSTRCAVLVVDPRDDTATRVTPHPCR